MKPLKLTRETEIHLALSFKFSLELQLGKHGRSFPEYHTSGGGQCSLDLNPWGSRDDDAGQKSRVENTGVTASWMLSKQVNIIPATLLSHHLDNCITKQDELVTRCIRQRSSLNFIPP
jgi:hypothetical protein